MRCTLLWLLTTAGLLAQDPPAVSPGKTGEVRAARLKQLELQLGDAVERTRWRAIHACVRLGKPAVPMLIRLVAGSGPFRRDAAQAAVAALIRIGPAAVPCLDTAQRLLREGDDDARELAFDLIEQVGPHDPENAETLRQAVYGELHGRRGKGAARRRRGPQRLVLCMVHLHGNAEVGAGELLEHLQGSSAGHLEMALDALVWYRGDTEKIVPVLRELLERQTLPRRTRFRFSGRNWGWSGSISSDHDQAIRTKAALLLIKLTGGRGIPATAHVGLLQHPDPSVRRRSVLQLGSTGAAAVGAVGIRALERATGDRDKLVAWDAITALGMLGPGAARAIPCLESLARAKDKAKAARATAALRMVKSTR